MFRSINRAFNKHELWFKDIHRLTFWLPFLSSSSRHFEFRATLVVVRMSANNADREAEAARGHDFRFHFSIQNLLTMSLFHYITYKLVVIKDKRLGVIYYSFAFMIILFTLVEIFVNKGYLEVCSQIIKLNNTMLLA